MERRLAWGILATGGIARAFAAGVRGSRTGRLAAVGSRTAEGARAFAAAQEVPAAHAHGSYEALLADPEVEAIYVATPHPQHVEWTVRALEAGKHVLCEKPIGLTVAEAQTMVAAARRTGRCLMEAWMYRCHPQTARVVELVREGAIGEVGMVQATFSFHLPFDPAHRLWNARLAGGGILDVGGYPVSWARLIAGAAAGKPFLDPVEVKGVAVPHPQTGVDAWAAAVLRFPNRILAQVACGVGLAQELGLRIYGSEGWMHVPSPFFAAIKPEPVRFTLHRGGRDEEIVLQSDRGLYACEADAFGEAVRAGATEVPACTLDDTLGNMAALDAWRQSGLGA